MTEKGLRLEGGEGSSIGNQTGRVSILQYGIWGRVCPNSWDDDDANVVCRMKGYLGGVAYKFTSQGENRQRQSWVTLHNYTIEFLEMKHNIIHISYNVFFFKDHMVSKVMHFFTSGDN